MGKQSYSEEQKAEVMAALMTGQSVSSVAKEYKIPKGTVSNWKRGNGVGGTMDRTQNGEEIGDLILDYLRQNLKTLRIHADAFADRQWLAKQSASELAVLHGVMTDKAVRLLEAMGANDSDAA
jgi:transposase